MGYGRDEENPVSEEEETEQEAERKKLKPSEEDGMELQKIEVKTVKTKDGVYPEMIAGHSDSLIKAHHLKYMLLGFNLFLSILGLALLGVSIWLRVDPEFWEYETTLKVDNFYTVCTMLIIASLIVVVVGFIGCLGAATERRWMLILYIAVFGLIFLLELAAVILMWSAPYSKGITNEVDKQLKKQIERREHDDSSRNFMDFIQSHLECCGSTDFKDYYEKGKSEVPDSCQNEQTGSINTGGCKTKILSYIRSKAGIVGGIALPILLVQLLALIAAICLIKSLEVESRYFM